LLSREHATVIKETLFSGYRFQTDMLTLIMDHLVDADILIGEQAALPIVPGHSLLEIALTQCPGSARIRSYSVSMIINFESGSRSLIRFLPFFTQTWQFLSKFIKK